MKRFGIVVIVISFISLFSSRDLFAEKQEMVRGKIVISVGCDFKNGKSKMEYFLQKKDSTLIPLQNIGSSPPRAGQRAILSPSGKLRYLRSHREKSGKSDITINEVSGTINVLIVLLQPSDEEIPWDAEKAEEYFQNSKEFIEDARQHSKVELSVEVKGWVKSEKTKSELAKENCSSCPSYLARWEAIELIDDSVNFNDVDCLITVVADNDGKFTSAWASIGIGGFHSTDDGDCEFSSVQIGSNTFKINERVISHELIHALLSRYHGAGMKTPKDGCSYEEGEIKEYLDTFSVMGNSHNFISLYSQYELGWLSNERIENLKNSTSVEVELHPKELEDTDGKQLIIIENGNEPISLELYVKSLETYNNAESLETSLLLRRHIDAVGIFSYGGYDSVLFLNEEDWFKSLLLDIGEEICGLGENGGISIKYVSLEGEGEDARAKVEINIEGVPEPSPSPTPSPSPSPSPTPTATPTSTTITPKIAAGDDYTLALKSDGTVWAWGANDDGQLGDGSTTDRNTPNQVSGLSNVTAIDGGHYRHSLAVKSDGTVWAWGSNDNGHLGDGTYTNRTTPVQASNLSNVTAVAGGDSHSLALKSNGTVWAWGGNWYGQLGNGTYDNSISPVQVSSLSNIIAIAAGDQHSLALKSDGTVWAWGENAYGKLGDGATTNRSAPIQVSGLSGVTAIAVGDQHSLALKSDGTVWAWGSNEGGQLGDGTTTNRSLPIQVINISDVTAIAAGYKHGLAIKSNSTVWAWGYNGDGQLGDGGTADRYSPIQVNNLDSVTAIAAGDYHSIALKSDGTVWTWGYNGDGELGNGNTMSRNIPIQVNINLGQTETPTPQVTPPPTVYPTPTINPPPTLPLPPPPLPSPKPDPTPTEPVTAEVSKLKFYSSNMTGEKLILRKGKSCEVSVEALSDGHDGDVPVPYTQIKVKGGRKVRVSPSSAFSDSSGSAKFTITARTKGNGKIFFTAQNVKKILKVRVK